jgi:hypothetical protein
MSEQKKLGNKFDQLFNTLVSGGKKITRAFQEEINASNDSLSCLQQGTLDFELIEQDIIRIHQQLEEEDSVILGSHLFLDDKNNLMEIQTYAKKKGKTFVNTISANVKLVTNLPANIVKELKEKGSIELHLKPDE